MLTLEEARGIAFAELARLQSRNPNALEPAILDQHTLAKDWGWVFFWQSRLYFETGDRGYRLGGNAPLIVNRFDRSVHPTGTARPVEEYIEAYERTLEGR